MNTAIGWEDTTQDAANVDPFTSKNWPGAILFGDQSAYITFAATDVLGTGEVVLEISANPISLIKFVHNGGWLASNKSDTVFGPNAAPIMDVLCVIADNAGASFKPFQITRVVNDTTLVIKDPYGICNTNSPITAYFSQLNFYPNKQVTLQDPSYLSVFGLGGAEMQTLIEPSFTSTNLTFPLTGQEIIPFIGCATSVDTKITVIK